MQDSSLLIYIASEVAILLLIVCIFLFFHIGRLKKLIGKLEDKITDLRQSLSTSRKAAAAALKKLAEKEKIKPKRFLDYLDEAIDDTLTHHQSLNPDRDIVLDITADAPIERQVCSLRHAFLIAEKEACCAGSEQQSSWDVLQSKLQQIVSFYENASAAKQEKVGSEDSVDLAQISNYKKKIENLEHYKTLFLDTEDKWKAAKTQAQQYYSELMEKSKAFDDDGAFEALLQNYSRAYDDVEALIIEGSTDNLVSSPAPDAEHLHSDKSKLVFDNHDEMQRLKNMAVDQHKVITELKRQLIDAKSPEEQQEAIEQLTQQLEQQQRFLSEAETCTQLIEDELSRAMQENEQLRDQMQGNVEKGTASNNEAESLKNKVSELQQELLNLQTQHIELEERYLELKMGG